MTDKLLEQQAAQICEAAKSNRVFSNLPDEIIDTLVAYIDQLKAERDEMMDMNFRLAVERNKFMYERDEAIRQRDELATLIQDLGARIVCDICRNHPCPHERAYTTLVAIAGKSR